MIPPPDGAAADLRAALTCRSYEVARPGSAALPCRCSPSPDALEEQLQQASAPLAERIVLGLAGTRPCLPSARRRPTWPVLSPAACSSRYVANASDYLYTVIIGAGRRRCARSVRRDRSGWNWTHSGSRWRRLLTGHGSAASLRGAAQLAERAAGRLDDALLAPLAPLPAGCSLVLVPPGSLRSLPWPMLPGCANRPVTVAPSAVSWLAARQREASRPPGSPQPARARADRRVVLVAGPGLHNATTEVAALSQIYPGAQVLTGSDATVGATLRAMNGAHVAHVAAHGSFRVDNPLFSSLLLADGPLTVHDLERLDSAPRTIMLAACDSALSPAGPGDEMTGLAAALLAVGANAVIAPLLPLPGRRQRAVGVRLAPARRRRSQVGGGSG